MIIKDYMCIICRTEEEKQLVIATADKEGWIGLYTHKKASMMDLPAAPMCFTTGYYGDRYPDALTYSANLNTERNHLQRIEATDLFQGART